MTLERITVRHSNIQLDIIHPKSIRNLKTAKVEITFKIGFNKENRES